MRRVMVFGLAALALVVGQAALRQGASGRTGAGPDATVLARRPGVSPMHSRDMAEAARRGDVIVVRDGDDGAEVRTVRPDRP